MTRVLLALALVLALVVAANATAGHRRATHRVLQPLAQHHVHVHATASETDAAVQQHDEDVAAGLPFKEADFTNRGMYSYPAADIGAPGGHIPATVDCRIAADVFAYALHKDTGSGKKGWPMVGVGLTTTGHWIVALSGNGAAVYKADSSDPEKLKDAVATRDFKRYGGAAAVMPDVIKRMLSTHSQPQMHAYANSGFTDLSDGRALGWTKLYLNSVGRAMGAYDDGDAEGTSENAPMPFVAAGALQCPHRREDVLPTAPGPGNTHVWARRRYSEPEDQYSWSHQNVATHVYRTQTATVAAGVAQGNPFGKCAGSKIAAYARVAGLTLQCMAERKYENDNIRASCLTCQHAIGEMFQANAINARNTFVANKQNAINDLTQQISVSEGELLVLDGKAQDLVKQLEEAGAKYKRLSRAAESSGTEIKLKEAELKTVAREYYVNKRLESELQKGVRVCARHRAELRQWVNKDSPQSNYMSIGMGVPFRKSGRNKDADELTLSGDIAPALLKLQEREKELAQEISDLREIADDHQVIMKINQEMINTRLSLDKQQLLASKLKHQIEAAKDLRTRLQRELTTFGRFD